MVTNTVNLVIAMFLHILPSFLHSIYFCLSICLSTSPFTSLSFLLSICRCIFQSTCMSGFLLICLFCLLVIVSVYCTYMSVYLPVYLSVNLSAYLLPSTYSYLYVHLSV